jgi:hypothetical protein
MEIYKACVEKWGKAERRNKKRDIVYCCDVFFPALLNPAPSLFFYFKMPFCFHHVTLSIIIIYCWNDVPIQRITFALAMHVSELENC